jgi:hypothetical protein
MSALVRRRLQLLTFSAAATASDGLTVAGSALAIVLVALVAAFSSAGTEMTRNIGPAFAGCFGVRPCRSVSASTVASNLV